MLDPGSPMLPWKLTSLVLLVFAALTGWTIPWDPFQRSSDQEDYLRRLGARVGGGPAVLFVGNSRLGHSIYHDSQARELLSAAGMSDYKPMLVVGPNFHISILEGEEWRVRAMRPTLLVVQVDLFAPGDSRYHSSEVLDRIRTFERDGSTAERVRAVFADLEGCRKVAVEIPYPKGVVESMGPEWARDRQALLRRVESLGYEVIGDAEPWPDDLYSDPRHLSAAGTARLRVWLAAELRALPEPS